MNTMSTRTRGVARNWAGRNRRNATKIERVEGLHSTPLGLQSLYFPIRGWDKQMNMKIRMSPVEVNALKGLMQKSWFYLEFGCGGSTALAVENCRGLMISIESDSNWINEVKKDEKIKEAISLSKLFMRHIDVGEIGLWGAPKNEDKIKNWPQYYITPFRDYDFDYDLVLIDGRFRNTCTLVASMFCGQSCVFAFHDYPRRWKHSMIEKYFDVEDVVDTLAIMKRRARVNLRALYLDILTGLFDVQ